MDSINNNLPQELFENKLRRTEGKAFSLTNLEAGKEKQSRPIALVKWEDITAYTRVEIPEDFEIFRLTKLTVGILWKEAQDYIVLVQDYDLSNDGKGYRHNDFHIIPRGTIKEIKTIGQIEL
jgi:hypothetical protein